jgi:hypothetical protein
MKKFILIAAIGIITAFTASAQRFGSRAGDDYTGRSLTLKSYTVTIGSTDSIAPNASFTFYKMAVAGAKTLHIKNTNAQLWDRCHIQFTADATTRLITLTGTAMLADINRDTISVMSSRTSFVEFYYNGTKWVQCNRYQQH